MVQGLSVDDVVQVSINLAPIAAPTRNFGALCIIGPSPVIDTRERIRQYASLDGVATDFGITAPEYLAADLFFSQDPQPSILYVERWAATNSSGVLNGAHLGSTQQSSLLTALRAVTTGAMTISVDGSTHNLTNLDFSNIGSLGGLNSAASVVDTALAGAAVFWNAPSGRFEVTSGTSGTSSTVSYATNAGGSIALADALGLSVASGASAPVNGILAEQPLAAITALSGLNGDIYGVIFAPSNSAPISDDQYLACAAFVEGASPVMILGITAQEPGCVDPSSVTDIAFLVSSGGYSRTATQYSSSSAYSIASAFSRAFTTDFNANNTVITLKFKQEPGVVPESLTETQAATLRAKHCNVFVNYINDTAIIQEGVMGNGTFFDERHGCDWLQNRVQTDVYNLLYTSPTKIPQTDSGVHQIVTTVEASLDAAVNNGLVAPGIWTSSLEFGSLKRGKTLTKGYYVFAPSVNTQSQSAREARIAPSIQVAAKLAGAVHFAGVAININR